MEVEGRRLALVVTVDRYENPGLRALAAPAADAKALAEVLGSPEYGGFELEFLHNPTSWTANEKVDGLLADRRPGDLVLLHFSCHGLKDVDGELYLATTNTVPDRLASTSIDSAWVNRMMQRSRAQRVVLLLDCCYGGAFERGVLARAGGGIDVGDRFRPDHLGESRGRVVITASAAMEYAFEGTELSDGGTIGPSVFTGALVEGIRTGAADRDQDGFVGLDELYDYVHDRVREESPQQTPCKWEFGLRGELYVARNPHRRVAPIPLPQEILDLLDHSAPGARMAAVDELTRLAAGPGLARAAAARLALVDLVEDDSRRVAASARKGLRDTAVHLPSATIDLGDAPRGTTRLDTRVRVGGPPLALASLVTTSGDGLRARVDAEDLRISWAAAPGRLDGLVTLSGPAGEASLRVLAGRPEDPEPAVAAADVRRWLPIPKRSVWLFVAVLVLAALVDLGIRAALQRDGEVATPYRPPAVTPTGRPVTSVPRPVVVASMKVGQSPQGVAVSPDSKTVYVVNQAAHTLSMIDVATRESRFNVPLPTTPRYVAAAPDGARLYVSMFEEDDSGSAVAVIDAKSAKVLETVATGPKPYALTVAADGLLWVPIHSARKVEVYDSALKMIAVVPTPENPHAVVISADGQRAYTPDHESNMISIIDTRTYQVVADIPVGTSPHSLAVAPDGGTVIVANYDDNTVNLIDTETRRVTGPFRVGTDPQSVAFASDGARAYVVNEGDSSVSTVTTADGKVTSTRPVGKSPRVIAVAPNGRYAYITNGDANTVTVLKVQG